MERSDIDGMVVSVFFFTIWIFIVGGAGLKADN